MTAEEKWDLVQYRIINAKKTHREVEVLIQNRLWNTAVNRLYYACFYAVTSLLLNRDVNVKTHSGTRQMFGLHFVDTGLVPPETGHYYKKLFFLRHKGDYEDYIDFEESDVLELMKPAAEMITQIELLLSQPS